MPSAHWIVRLRVCDSTSSPASPLAARSVTSSSSPASLSASSCRLLNTPACPRKPVSSSLDAISPCFPADSPGADARSASDARRIRLTSLVLRGSMRMRSACSWRSGGGAGAPGRGCSGAEDLRRLASPEPYDDISLVAEEVVDLFRTPQVQFEVPVLPLENCRLVGRLGALRGGRGGDDPMAGAEGPPPTGERLHGLPQVPRSELLIILAWDDDESAFCIPARQVDVVGSGSECRVGGEGREVALSHDQESSHAPVRAHDLAPIIAS